MLARRVILLLVGLGLLAGQAALRPGLQATQVERGLVMTARNSKGVGADTSVPVLALGAFRGLLIDYLWLRAMSLREQGRHHEARQLAQQICALQPRMWEVWSYMGHDLAYNVATVVDDPDERWRWVRNGIVLLRDQGIRANPNAPELYFMLARVFQDKIASQRDDWHKLFKQKHASAMLAVLGDPQVDLAALAAAPGWEELVLGDADARATVELLQPRGEDPRRVALDLELTRVKWPEKLASAVPAADPLRARMELPSWATLVLAARASLVRETQALDPARMLAVDREWGPLDWRCVDATTIYWASEGLRVAREREILPRQREMLRTTLSALRNAMNFGRLEVYPDGELFFAPMLDLVPKVEVLTRESAARAAARMDELRAKHEDPRGSQLTEEEEHEAIELDGFITNQRYARLDFLLQGVQLLHDYGREKGARDLYQTARKEFPAEPQLARDYDTWVNLMLAKRFLDPEMLYETHVTVSQLTEGCWVSAYTALALGQDEKYQAMRRLAEAQELRWRRYLIAQEGIDPRARKRLDVPFDQVRQRAIYTAGRRLSPFLRRRLAERAGLDEKVFESRPELNLPPPVEGGE